MKLRSPNGSHSLSRECSVWTRYYDANKRICAHLSTIELARRNRQGDCPPTQGKYSKQINIKERSSMTKTSEKRSKPSTKLGLIVCLGVLPLLYGITGCSTGKPVAQNSPRNEDYSSMVGPAG